jgi:hypothetical protein
MRQCLHGVTHSKSTIHSISELYKYCIPVLCIVEVYVLFSFLFLPTVSVCPSRFDFSQINLTN